MFSRVTVRRLEQGSDRCLHELSRDKCRCSRHWWWKAAGRESQQQQANAGHPHEEARGSEGLDCLGVVVGTGGDGVEDSEAPSTMSIAAAWERSGR